jgi:hypothetical protein
VFPVEMWGMRAFFVSVCTGMHIYMCVCVYVCMCVYGYVCAYVCGCIYVGHTCKRHRPT